MNPVPPHGLTHRRAAAFFQSLAFAVFARPLLPAAYRARESGLLLAGLLLVLLTIVAPAIPQAAHYHHFADQRGWAGLPNALDVLTNLAFLTGGLVGFTALGRAVRRQATGGAEVWMAALFFSGLVVTAGVSAAYHWHPDDAGLFWDRAGMVMAFTGLLGLGAARNIGARAAVVLACSILLLGPLSLHHWAATGNLLPWATLQAGGMAFIVWLATLRDRPACLAASVAPAAPATSPVPASPPPAIRWGAVIALYICAKVFEGADAWVFEASGHFVSGHSLKHLFAAAAAWPVIFALDSSFPLARPTLNATLKPAHWPVDWPVDLPARLPAHFRAESSSAGSSRKPSRTANKKGKLA